MVTCSPPFFELLSGNELANLSASVKQSVTEKDFTFVVVSNLRVPHTYVERSVLLPTCRCSWLCKYREGDGDTVAEEDVF